jgi:dienelactone hydrolase
VAIQAHTDSEKHDIGNLHQFVKARLSAARYPLAYRRESWPELEQWKTIAKAKVFELLSYFPAGEDLSPRVIAESESDGLREQEMEFSTAQGIRVRGILLTPTVRRGRLPAVVALHDHGGFYYFGKEKIVARPKEPAILKKFKDDYYGGRSWATEIARRGYVVLSIDAFYFGTRRLDFDSVSDLIVGRNPYRPQEQPSGSDAYIREYNLFCEAFEQLLVKHILVAGATWPGIMFFDDRRSVDFLLTREEVDPERIGCCGLSIGGYRSAHLAALEPRIRCAVVAGWMTTYESLLEDRLRDHTYMIYIPGLTRYLDLPDLVSLTAPNALFVQQCVKDSLYNIEGMRESCEKISSVYQSIGCGEKFKSAFYDVSHQFNRAMQEEAFSWLDRWLK